jgi:DUF1680 family protein
MVELSFDMSTRLLRANSAVDEDRGRVAFQRGPIVFCMEMLDQPHEAHVAEIVGYTAHLDAVTEPRYAPDLLDGVMVLEHPGSVAKSAAATSLYFTAGEDKKVAESPTTLRLIPYYAWANRAPSSMQVWIPYRIG